MAEPELFVVTTQEECETMVTTDSEEDVPETTAPPAVTTDNEEDEACAPDTTGQHEADNRDSSDRETTNNDIQTSISTQEVAGQDKFSIINYQSDTKADTAECTNLNMAEFCKSASVTRDTVEEQSDSDDEQISDSEGQSSDQQCGTTSEDDNESESDLDLSNDLNRLSTSDPVIDAAAADDPVGVSPNIQEETLDEFLTSNSFELRTQFKPHLRHLTTQMVYYNEMTRLQKSSFGKENPGVPEKIIMVVGATGAGKTTLINGMINYVFGVKWDDPQRYVLVREQKRSQAYSQTQYITAYTIHHHPGFQVPFTLTIIDTPGFGDTSGVTRDKQITEQIKTFFTTTEGFGIDHIDCICLVVQASLARLTYTQRYIFDHILALFGIDIARNIYMMLTFADAKKPPVLEGIKAAGLPFEGFFKFNNSALYADNGSFGKQNESDDESAFDALFWKMGTSSFGTFMSQLGRMESRSLILTKEVLDERDKIQTHVHGIQIDIKLGLTKLDILDREINLINQHQAEIEANKDFTYYVNEVDIQQVPIPAGQYITNCITCNRTCHQRCIYKDDADKIHCSAMANGNCFVCPKGCHWSEHKNMSIEIVVATIKVKKTYSDLEKRYRDAGQKRLSAKDVIEKVSDEFIATQMGVMSKTEIVRKGLEHLREIALKPDPLSSLEYIDMLIDAEKAEHKPGWRERVGQLLKIRKEVDWMLDIATKGHDPFRSYTEKIQKQSKNSLVLDALVSFGDAIKTKFTKFFSFRWM